MLTDLSASALVSAIEADQHAAWASLGRAPVAQRHEGPEVAWVVTGIPHPAFNVVTRSRFEPESADAKIKETLAHFASRNMPLSWWLGPSARPANLAKRLESHGLTRVEDPVGMAVDLGAVSEQQALPSGLSIEHVVNERMLRQLVHASTIGAGIPESVEEGLLRLLEGAGFGRGQSWRYYLALLNGEPVATASLFLGSDVASINDVRTVPQARRQGFGSAVTLAALHEARELGYRVATLQASPMGYGVYRKIGFTEYFKFGLYEWWGVETGG